ncbi:MAG: PH domain-containing protein [Candidatus Thorarchaeota archaeon]|jgi:hypothetical protein
MTGAERDQHNKPIEQERLIGIYHPKRVASLIYYVLGVISFFIGVLANVAGSAQFVEYSEVTWYLGIAAIVFGVSLISWAEIRRYHKLYIITTWNIRIRNGYWNKKTKRIFYNDISSVNISSDSDDRAVDQGDIEIFGQKDDVPYIVFARVHNPIGVSEIIKRFLDTILDPLPWAHIEKEDLID